MSDFGATAGVLFAQQGCMGVITLARPDALNALTHDMVRAIMAALSAWEGDDSVKTIVIRAKGRAFCAGGDIQAIYRAGLEGSPLYDFFADEYRLNARIESYPKPYIALIDGIVMGGGVGVSIHGSHRVFTENARFAMPEVTIGFFPDVGGSHFLPRLPSGMGLWLGLTGSRFGWGDGLWCGLATHAVRAVRLDALMADLSQADNVETVLARYSETPPREIDDAAIALIGDLFSATTLADLTGELQTRADAEDTFAAETLARLSKASPTSLNVAFRQIRAGAQLSMRQCMAMEYRIVSRMLKAQDFYEGIRAAVIDRDGAPRWQPALLEQVEQTDIDSYFASLGQEELELDAGRAGAA